MLVSCQMRRREENEATKIAQLVSVTGFDIYMVGFVDVG